MSLLLATTPYIAAVALYWLSCGDLFGIQSEPPARWIAQLCLSVLTAALTPLAVAAATTGGGDELLLTASAAGVLFSTLILAASTGPQTFHYLQRSTRLGRWRPQRWKLVRAAGVLVIVYAGAVTVAAAR